MILQIIWSKARVQIASLPDKKPVYQIHRRASPKLLLTKPEAFPDPMNTASAHSHSKKLYCQSIAMLKVKERAYKSYLHLIISRCSASTNLRAD